MDLRAQHKWTSFGMTSRMWVSATAAYNTLLATRCQAQGLPDPILKHPRALVEKLGEVETMIVRRVATKDFKSKSGGSEDFWRRHCGVISLVKIDPGTTSEKNLRKLPMCARCKQMKYLGGTGSAANHRRDYCSDGVRCSNKLKAGTDIIPDWPQPPGIFTSGSKFHAIEFLKALRDLHEKTVNNDSSNVVIDLEGLAFAKMFQTRTIKADDSAGGMYLFRLFDNLEMIPALPELVVNYNNLKYLRLDCLGGAGSPASAADASAAEVPIGEGGEGLEGELVDF
ncbi:hypothetical protein K466DRAFT_607378 [Polyporus arcularius HHB13444]|uniref:Uncharacterized protein n=1 Tax=Polyporus arcularius HHB13444 TaxID=1314778 RepID=A0A5C3NLE9_9APHY|nr:hypothetical protein K466DRAFT_607378 [Polyporus arcularius HHB13444]